MLFYHRAGTQRPETTFNNPARMQEINSGKMAVSGPPKNAIDYVYAIAKCMLRLILCRYDIVSYNINIVSL